MLCLNCNKETNNPKFCNNSCAASFNNKNRAPRTAESKVKTGNAIRAKFVYTKVTPCVDCGNFFPHTAPPSCPPKRCVTCRKTFKSKLMAKSAVENGFGGHTSKTTLYFKKNDGTEVYLQSSYEIRFAELLEEMDVEWSRPSPLVWVDSNGKSHRYYPDFKIGSTYIDTKNNYLATKDAEKIRLVAEQNRVMLQVVLNEQITKEFIALLTQR